MYIFARFVAFLWFKLYYNVRFEGLENIPKDTTCIFASNHRSYADPVVISIPIKRRFAYMAKKELFKNLFFRGLISTLGAFPVDRGHDGAKIIETSVEKLESGRNLLIFPEGKRSHDGTLGRGKSGVILIALKARVPVVPVAVCFEGKLRFRRKIVVRFGEKIPAFTIEGEPSPRQIKEMKDVVMNAISGLLNEHINTGIINT